MTFFIGHMNRFLTDINFSTQLPVYQQLCWHIKQAIFDGQLKSGQRIPSTRNLANQLNIARGTVEKAYDILTDEGLLITNQQRGTFVANIPLAIQPAQNLQHNHLSSDLKVSDRLLPFQLGVPAVDAFPLVKWNRLLGHVSRTIRNSLLAYPDPQGEMPLREAIASYLRISRGIDCHQNQIFITAGYSSAVRLITSIILSASDKIALENPSFPQSRILLSNLGYQTISVEVDSNGLNPAFLNPDTAKATLLTPAHQSPLGVTLTLERRLKLIDWATQNNHWLIEDDYDGEYRYTGYPLPALKSLDTQQRVFYVGSFSKVLFPALRLAYFVVPESLIEAFSQSFKYQPCLCPVLTQLTVAKFMSDGHFFRHLKKMRQLYAKRRELLASALEKNCPSVSKIECHQGGMNIIAHLPFHLNDKKIVTKARQHQLAIEALSDGYATETAPEKKQNGLLLGFTNIDSRENAEQICCALQEVINSESKS